MCRIFAYKHSHNTFGSLPHFASLPSAKRAHLNHSVFLRKNNRNYTISIALFCVKDGCLCGLFQESMCIMSYLALMCIEIQNVLNVDLFESPYNEVFYDMRNSLPLRRDGENGVHFEFLIPNGVITKENVK